MDEVSFENPAAEHLSREIEADMVGHLRDLLRDAVLVADPDSITADRTLAGAVEAVLRPNYHGFFSAIDAASSAVSFSADMTYFDKIQFLTTYLTELIESESSNVGYCARWIMQSVVMPRSSLFPNTCVAEDLTDFADQVLELRRESYRATREGIVQMIQAGMSLLRRVTREHITPAQLAAVLHALIDGCILQRSLEPDLLTSEYIAKQMMVLALELTEPGGISDPRRPSTGSATFERVVDIAITQWRARGTVTVDSVFQEAGQLYPDADGLRSLFPSVSDLADSALRREIDAGGQFSIDRLNEGDLTRSNKWGPEVGVVADRAITEFLDGSRDALRAFGITGEGDPALIAYRTGALAALRFAATALIRVAHELPGLRTAILGDPPVIGRPFLEELEESAARVLADVSADGNQRSVGEASLDAASLLAACLEGNAEEVNAILGGRPN